MKSLADWRDAPQKVAEYEEQLEIAKKRTKEAAEEYRKNAEKERIRKEKYEEYLAKYPEKKNEDRYNSRFGILRGRINQEKNLRPKLGTLGTIFLILFGIGSTNLFWGLSDGEVGLSLLGLLPAVFFLALLFFHLSSLVKWKKSLRQLEKEEAVIKKKLEELASMPSFEEFISQESPFPANLLDKEGEMNLTASAPEALAYNSTIVQWIVDEVRDSDRTEKLSRISEALANDEINEEEYKKLIEVLGL